MSMLKIKQSAESIQTQNDFVNFLNQLHKAYLEGSEPWENKSLEDFLGALSAWTKDMDGYYKNLNNQQTVMPSWKTFAEMLMAATVYE